VHPGFIPEPLSPLAGVDHGQIYVVQPDGAGRFRPNVPSGYV
jgi:hypothetical protein